STIFPGAGHLAAGRRRTGAVALIGFLTLVGVGAGFVLTRSKSELLVYSVRPDWMLALMIGAIVLATAWVLAIIGAYSVAKPPYMTLAQRIGGGLVVLLLCAAVARPLGTAAHYAYIQRDLINSLVSSDGPDPLAGQSRVNVLLIGGDAGPDRTGVRTDSMTVASIDVATGDTVLIGLPRNLYRAPFPFGSPLHNQFPGGFAGEPAGEFILNAVWEYGEHHPSLVPAGGGHPGAAALLSSVETILDLDVNYWILVNLAGFREMVDAVGGVTIRVDQRIPIGGGTAPITGWIEPGVRELSGYQALWYTRSRALADDYSRMARQRCMLGALARQIDPMTVLTRFPQIAGATKVLIDTNLSQRMLERLAEVAGKAGSAEITTVQFVPPLINTGDPNYPFIRSTTRDAIAASQRAAAQHVATSRPGQSAGHSGSAGTSDPVSPGTGSTGSDLEGGAALDDVCGYE
ncbi:MAG: LCP family protein, partial [Sporichthyaceae bacterium]|nr:LCP family protein [Sporichthyaceae bacterium]